MRYEVYGSVAGLIRTADGNNNGLMPMGMRKYAAGSTAGGAKIVIGKVSTFAIGVFYETYYKTFHVVKLYNNGEHEVIKSTLNKYNVAYNDEEGFYLKMEDGGSYYIYAQILQIL